jgi:methylmalonyl-CoA/ethylmalonyl-CoA epimerase
VHPVAVVSHVVGILIQIPFLSQTLYIGPGVAPMGGLATLRGVGTPRDRMSARYLRHPPREAGMEILQVAQHADDLDRAAAFYTELLGEQPAGRFDPPGLLFFNVGVSRLLLEKNAPSAVIYLQVDDAQASIEAARARGVEIIEEPRVIFSHQDDSLGPAGTDEWMGFIRDSEGNTVGLVSHEPRHDP